MTGANVVGLDVRKDAAPCLCRNFRAADFTDGSNQSQLAASGKQEVIEEQKQER